LKILVPSGKAARIAGLLRNHGYRVRFRSPAAGRLTITWSSVPRRSPFMKGKTRPVLVANASATFSRPRLATVKIALTKKGRQLRKNSKRLRLTAKARFTMPHRNPVTVSKGFTIKR
jgi:hypothetical protein